MTTPTDQTSKTLPGEQCGHTAGPWESIFDEGAEGLEGCEIRHEGAHIATTYGMLDFACLEQTEAIRAEMEANARLIAAAPELLEALQLLFGLAPSESLVSGIDKIAYFKALQLKAMTDEWIESDKYCQQTVFDLRDRLTESLEERDELRVALRACVGALEFFEKAGFNGGCTLALAAARTALEHAEAKGQP